MQSHRCRDYNSFIRALSLIKINTVKIHITRKRVNHLPVGRYQFSDITKYYYCGTPFDYWG